MRNRQIDKSINLARVEEAIKRQFTTLDNPGFCIACGHEQEGCEPDACDYECEECGSMAVYGAARIVMLFTDQLV